MIIVLYSSCVVYSSTTKCFSYNFVTEYIIILLLVGFPSPFETHFLLQKNAELAGLVGSDIGIFKMIEILIRLQIFFIIIIVE
jgi:hypothetical protein